MDHSIDVPTLFYGADTSSTTKHHYSMWKKEFYRVLGRNKIDYVMDDESLFAPGRYPDFNEEEPVMDELLEVPEGTEFFDALRIKEYNLKIVTRHEARVKDYYHRVNLHERDLANAIALLQSGLGPNCPAQVLVENAMSPYKYLWAKLRAAMQALDDKFINVGTQTEQEILDELRDLTDEHMTVNQRNVEWLTRTQRLEAIQGATTTTRQLYDLYAKGIKNEFLRPFATSHTIDVNTKKEWMALAEHLSAIIDCNNRDKDTNPTDSSPPLSAAPTVVANTAVPSASSPTDAKKPTRIPCRVCGSNDHHTDHCTAEKCLDCGQTIPERRRDHRGLRCPGRGKRAIKNSYKPKQKPKMKRNKGPFKPDPALLSSYAAFLETYKKASMSGDKAT